MVRFLSISEWLLIRDKPSMSSDSMLNFYGSPNCFFNIPFLRLSRESPKVFEVDELDDSDTATGNHMGEVQP